MLKNQDQHATAKFDVSISTEDSKYMGFSPVESIYPYTILDSYNRLRKDKAFISYVLENEHLKARFIPSLGARLWSLYDKDTGRELLHENPVFQPCNLSLRNAWISGGVEWNVGIIGHSPFTLDRLFVRTKILKDGTPVVSFYQYERIRKLLYRVEAFLPAGAKQLFVRVRIDNPLDLDTATYWWSNIAVDERKDVRVLVPAEKAFHFHKDTLSKVDIPYFLNTDISYPTNIPTSMDFFFDIPKKNRKYIAALGADGYGLVQCSTNLLQGRKLFVWGQGRGGKNWQSYLSKQGSAYIEIQAGLAKTQLEHLPMPAKQSLSWLEAYGPLQADTQKIQDANWNIAITEATKALNAKLPLSELENIEAQIVPELDDSKDWKLLQYADGYAYLDKQIYIEFANCGLAFPSNNLGLASEWKALIQNGVLAEQSPKEAPLSYQQGEVWKNLLEKSLKQPKGRHWYSLYHLGVISADLGQTELAKQFFEDSIALKESAWSHVGLALLAERNGNFIIAREHISKALAMQMDRYIALCTLRIHNKAQAYEQSIALYHSFPRHLKALGRAKIFLAEALLYTKQYEKALALLQKPFVIADIREGEIILSELWFTLQEKIAEKRLGRALEENEKTEIRAGKLPNHLDFRMYV